MIQQLKVILLVIALFSTSLLFGQTQKHKIPVGGAIGGAIEISSVTSFFFSADISGGYFLSDGILVRAVIGYDYSNIGSSIGVELTVHQSKIGVGTRYYFKTGKLQPLIGLEISYLSEAYSYQINRPLNRKFQPALELGASYFISDNIALEIFSPITTTGNTTINIGTQIYLR